MIRHTKKVTAVIDIKNPKLIVSCGLDGNICLWDGESKEKNFIAEMEDPGSKNKRGVRCMTYSYEFGGNVLTCGFETHIKVW
jgi:WD40 repeat protein